MNLVSDEGVERAIVERLRDDVHAVTYIAELSPGMSDEAVLAEARRLEAPLVTKDKDFGELVFRQGLASFGVVLLRLNGLAAIRKSEIVAAVVADRSTELVQGLLGHLARAGPNSTIAVMGRLPTTTRSLPLPALIARAI